MRYCTSELVEEVTRLPSWSPPRMPPRLEAFSCSPATATSALLADAPCRNLPTTSPLSRSSYTDVQPHRSRRAAGRGCRCHCVLRRLSYRSAQLRPDLRVPCLICSSWMSAAWEDSRDLRTRLRRSSWRRSGESERWRGRRNCWRNCRGCGMGVPIFLSGEAWSVNVNY
jgi:hypothetical protein